MLEKNYTIPINEEFDKFDACPVCRLHASFERQSLEYIMGAAMMEPDVRIETNKSGFCTRHYHEMLSMRNKLSLALMLETHLKEIKGLLDEISGGVKNQTRAAAQKLAGMADDCFLCRRIASTLEKYCSNIVFLWKTEPEFREKLLKQPQFCFAHTAALLKSGLENLPAKQFSGFAADIGSVAEKALGISSDEVSRFCKSFDYRYSGEDLGEAKSACEHAVDWLTGSGQVAGHGGQGDGSFG
jgi:hypothetical protein